MVRFFGKKISQKGERKVREKDIKAAVCHYNQCIITEMVLNYEEI